MFPLVHLVTKLKKSDERTVGRTNKGNLNAPFPLYLLFKFIKSKVCTACDIVN